MLALSLATSQAQNIYSANVVGYINITIPHGGLAFIGNQLYNLTGTNNAAQIIQNLESDPNGITNNVLYYWTGSGFAVYYWYTAADADNQFGQNFGDGWYDSGGGIHNVVLNQGGGFFLANAENVGLQTVTLTGQVQQGTNTLPINTGYNALSIVPPLSTNIDCALLNTPNVWTSDPNGTTNDALNIWTGSGYRIAYYYTATDADNQFGQNFGNGWYDSGGGYHSLDPLYIPQVGQAFFVQHFGGTKNWVYVYTVPQS